MDKRQKELVNAAVSVLFNAGVPFVLVTPDNNYNGRLKVHDSSDGQNYSCTWHDTVTISPSSERTGELDTVCDGESALPNGTVLSGICDKVYNFEYVQFNFRLDNDSKCTIFISDSDSLRHFRETLKAGDHLTIFVHFVDNKLFILDVSDIISHSRNLKE